MNLTLSLLSLTSFNRSPLLAQSFLGSQFTLNGVFAMRWVSSFTFNLCNARYQNCRFESFLRSVIHVDEYTVRGYHSTIPLATNEDSKIKVIDCLFQSGSEHNGGAINIFKTGCVMKVIRTGFLWCFAVLRGGAISFYGKVLAIEESCFDRCHSDICGLAIEAVVPEDDSEIKMTEVHITECTYSDELFVHQYNSLYFICGYQTAKYVNSTLCDAKQGGAFIGSEDAEYFDFTYIHISHPSGTDVLDLADLTSDNSKLSHMNLMYFRSSEDVQAKSLFYLGNSSVTLEYSTIVGCTIQYISVGGSLGLSHCATDLQKTIGVLNGTFSHWWTSFGKANAATVAIKSFDSEVCFLLGATSEQVIEAPDLALKDARLFPNSGMMHFLAISAIAAVIVFIYHIFFALKKRDINNLEDVQYE